LCDDVDVDPDAANDKADTLMLMSVLMMMIMMVLMLIR
jgi:hypothetical protein